MNRKPANAIDSDDSGSDWDTTVAESPVHSGPSKISSPVKVDIESDYAVVTPKPRSSLRDSSIESTGPKNSKSPGTSPRKENIGAGHQMASPPPHLTTFQNALSDYSSVYETAPDIPPRGYDGKGKLYTVPESDSFMSPQANVANWDDSDAEERVLKELQKNREKDRQRQQQQVTARDRKMALAGNERNNASADNHGYTPSPTTTRSAESTLEKWTRANENKQGKSPPPLKISDFVTEGNPKTVMINDSASYPHFKQSNRSVFVNDSNGKSCVFYFQEGSPHFVEVEDDGVDAYLPEKIDDIEKLFRRVWREVFSALRIITSFFILFVAEFILFALHHVARPLVLDSIRAIGDFLIKPLLPLLFNSIVQPIFSFIWNVFSSLATALEPFVRILGAILNQVAGVLRAIRLFVFNWHSSSRSSKEMEVV